MHTNRTRTREAPLGGFWSIVVCAAALSHCAWWRRMPVARSPDSFSMSRDGRSSPTFAPEPPQVTSYMGPPQVETCVRRTPAARSIAGVCRADPPTHRVECRPSCLDAALPDEAARYQVGAEVPVTYRVGEDGIFDEVAATRDPGCSLGAAAARALRRCCVPVPAEGRTLSQLIGVRGCHTVALHLPGFGR